MTYEKRLQKQRLEERYTGVVYATYSKERLDEILHVSLVNQLKELIKD